MIEQPPGRPLPALQGAPAGRTVIGDPAAVKIAALAARAVPGVHSLGPGAGRALGAIRDAVGANDPSHGVKVEVGQTQLAVDVSLTAEYGYALDALADAVRVAVYEALTELVGLEVIEVNVEILDVHLPPPVESKAVERVRPTGSTQLRQPVE